LENEGFVQVLPQRGVIVKEPSFEKVRDIFEVRMALEIVVCELISGKLKPHEISLIEQNLELQKQMSDEGDEPGYTKADSDFHIMLSLFSGNAEIHSIMTMYQSHLYRSALRVIRWVPNRMWDS